MSVLSAGVPRVSTPEPSDLDTVTMRVRRDLARMIRTICDNSTRGTKGMKVVDYLDDALRERVERDHAAVVQRLAEEEQSRQKKKRS